MRTSLLVVITAVVALCPTIPALAGPHHRGPVITVWWNSGPCLPPPVCQPYGWQPQYQPQPYGYQLQYYQPQPQFYQPQYQPQVSTCGICGTQYYGGQMHICPTLQCPRCGERYQGRYHECLYRCNACGGSFRGSHSCPGPYGWR
jgi:hypothetical protein